MLEHNKHSKCCPVWRRRLHVSAKRIPSFSRACHPQPSPCSVSDSPTVDSIDLLNRTLDESSPNPRVSPTKQDEFIISPRCNWRLPQVCVFVMVGDGSPYLYLYLYLWLWFSRQRLSSLDRKKTCKLSSFREIPPSCQNPMCGLHLRGTYNKKKEKL